MTTIGTERCEVGLALYVGTRSPETEPPPPFDLFHPARGGSLAAMEGTRLGPYQVLAELGSGGMGKVYRAEVAEEAPGLETGCSVALKVIHAHLLSQPGFFQRFLREADIGRSVQHENVVETYVADALLHEGVQQNFLVMEYVEGQTLRDLLEELERVPEELCRHIGLEVAKGLAAIHEAGVVHRDIKPENVLITEAHVVKVMDLGVARLQDEAIRLSQVGAFVGSLEYAAPEQFRSADGEPDGRADLHSLGVVLYELATGQHPYRDEDASRVLRNILDVAPRKAGEVNPQLTPFFEEVIGTLIAKDRDERFADAAALAAVLEEGEQGEWWKARAKALRIETQRPLRRIRVPRETALYGRDDDLAKLHALFDKAKAGDGQVLLIEGEAGIGKTRLVDEFVGRLRQDGEDINFLFGSYPPGGAATAAGAFSEAYRAQFGEEGSAPWLSQTPILVPAFDALLRGEPAPKGAEPLTKDSLGTVFVHATRNLAAERPTIVLIDDLHFAPEDARSLFMTLALAAPGHPVLLVGTMRPGVDESWISNVTRLDHASHTTLSRLGPKDLTRLLKDAFRSERLAEELGFKIAEKSDGNPFFAFEIIRGLREGQFITQQPDGTWVSTQVIDDIQIPSSVMDLVKARISDLTQVERDLLDVASCCGFEFDPGLLATVVGQGRIPVLKSLAQIERAHRLVRSQGRSFVFDHHQVQEAIYGSLPEMLREEYHAALADAVEMRAQAAERDPEDLDGALCVDLCEHFLKGGQGERALRYLDAGLDHLEKGYLNDQAIALADRALGERGLLGGARRVEMLLRMNARLDLLGRRRTQEAVLEEAHTLAEGQRAKDLLMRVTTAIGSFLRLTGRQEEAWQKHEHSLEIARDIGDRKGEADARGHLGGLCWSLGRYEEAREHDERRLAIACEIGDRVGEATATGGLALVFVELGRYEEARKHHSRSLAIARQIGDRLGEGVATGNLGVVAACQSRYDEAIRHHDRHLAIARDIGYRRGEGIARGNLGHIYTNLGRYKEAKEQFDRRLGIAREIGDRQGEAIAVFNLGALSMALGEVGEARGAFGASLAICRETRTHVLEGHVLHGLAALAQEEGDWGGASDLASQALAVRQKTGVAGVADSLVQLGESYCKNGNADEARSALQEAVDLLRQQHRKPELAHALSLLANLSDGDADAAEAALEEAEEAGNTPQTRYYLWKATCNHEHLAEAKHLLDNLIEHAPEECRESMLKNVRLNREIMEAWEEHGGEEA